VKIENCQGSAPCKPVIFRKL